MRDKLCSRCQEPARFVVASAITQEEPSCRGHLADRVTYALGLAVRVDVRRLPAVEAELVFAGSGVGEARA